ncbi:MAG: acetyltransferase [Syntrophothermus sp.]
MEKLVIVGGGGHAKVLISILKKNADYEILGYTDLMDNGSILGIKYLGDDSVLTNIIAKNSGCSAALGIGNISVVNYRKKLARKLEELKFNLPAIVSKTAILNEEVKIGEGTVIFDGAVVNSGTEIGKYSIINSNSTIEHDCTIGEFVHIAPGVTLSGGVKIGNNSMIGTGASVIQSIVITDNCMIGAGAAVVNDCTVPGTYLGVPARIRR